LLSTWFRVIRIKFLLASVIAVSVGLAISWFDTGRIDFIHAIIIMGGVAALHASVDLLNDYWDFKRGIDTVTKKTKLSGGTGVLPEGLLTPTQVYRAGIAFLILGSLMGFYFVILYGFVIAAILFFAVISIYFYSTKVVDSGLAELFVTIKGAMIVLGTFYIQTNEIIPTSILGGIAVGVLSSLVLFITSFPDHDADKSKGRKTLVILIGKQKATNLFWLFPGIFYGVVIFGIILEFFPIYCIITFLTIPILIKSYLGLRKNYENLEQHESIMNSVLVFSRITGVLLVISFLITLNNP